MKNKIIYKLKDGSIELKPEGNTYTGGIAHDIMHNAERIAREENGDFQVIIKMILDRLVKNNVAELI